MLGLLEGLVAFARFLSYFHKWRVEKGCIQNFACFLDFDVENVRKNAKIFGRYHITLRENGR